MSDFSYVLDVDGVGVIIWDIVGKFMNVMN